MLHQILYPYSCYILSIHLLLYFLQNKIPKFCTVYQYPNWNITTQLCNLVPTLCIQVDKIIHALLSNTHSDIRYMYCTKVPTKNPNPLFKSLLWNYRTSIFTWKWKHKNSTIHSTVPIHLHIQPDLPSWINIVFVWVDRNFQHQHIDMFTKNLFTNIVQSRI